jgi:tRNA(Ile)-lysidine synthase
MTENLSLAHVNHNLRGDESEADETFVVDLARRLGLEVQVSSIYPEKLRLQKRGRLRLSPEEAARLHRHEALNELAAATGALLVFAHHANDQAETILLRLLRGTTPDGLGAMTKISADGRILRPLLGVLKEEIEGYARTNGLNWREDSSNKDRRFARNRLRAEWVPELAAEFNPRLVRALARFGDSQGVDRDFFAREVRAAHVELVKPLPSGGYLVDFRGFRRMHEAIGTRFVARLFQEAGIARELTRNHVLRATTFLRTCTSGKVIEFPVGWKMEKRSSWVYFGKSDEA